MPPRDYERCEQCGFDGSRLQVGDAIVALRSAGRRWRELFEDVPEDTLRQRPEPQVWSALEYAAHTRDVIQVLGVAMHRILSEHRPMLGDAPDPDDVAASYARLNPSEVVQQLEHNVSRMAARAERAIDTAWDRVGIVRGEETDAGWVLRHAVHEVTHHLRDVRGGLQRLGEQD